MVKFDESFGSYKKKVYIFHNNNLNVFNLLCIIVSLLNAEEKKCSGSFLHISTETK